MNLDNLMTLIASNPPLMPPHPEEEASAMIRIGYLSGILEHFPLPQPRDANVRPSLNNERQYITVSIGFLAEGRLYSVMKDGVIQQLAKEIRDELKSSLNLTLQLFMESFIQAMQARETVPAVQTLIMAVRRAESRYGLPHPIGLGFAAIQFYGEQQLAEVSMQSLVSP